jgi:GNAT superfamily N-acetyltransferase
MSGIIRTDSGNKDFIALVRQLDAYLAITDGEDHAFYDQFNKIQNIRHVVVAYENQHPVGCGAIKEFEADSMEVKRMFVKPENRGKGIAAKILAELETWAAELGYSKCVLETGKRQVEAISLYKKCGYSIIPNYGQYIGMDNSLCFEKKLEKTDPPK